MTDPGSGGRTLNGSGRHGDSPPSLHGSRHSGRDDYDAGHCGCCSGLCQPPLLLHENYHHHHHHLHLHHCCLHSGQSCCTCTQHIKTNKYEPLCNRIKQCNIDMHVADYWQLCLGRGQVLFVGCLTSQQHGSVPRGRICSDNFTCCHAEIKAADQTFYLTQSQYTDTGSTSPSTDLVTPSALQGSHCIANF